MIMSIGISLLVEDVWFWGRNGILDNVLYFSGALLRFGEWPFVWFL